MGENQVHPSNGTVAFGSGLHGWAFTVTFFARVLAEKFKVEQDILMKKLWADNFYDTKAKKWTSSETGEDGTALKRGFVQFIMEPILKLSRNIMDNNKDAVWKMLGALKVDIKEADREKVGKDLLKHIF